MTAWPPVSVVQRKIDLKDTISVLKNLPTDASDALTTALSRYLVIRSAGYIEAVRDDVADLYSGTKSSEEITRRIRHSLRKGQGVTPIQLLDFVKSYSANWYNELDQLLCDEDNELKDSLGALVSARKKVAHGDGEQVTASKALKWSTTALTIASWLVQRFDPNESASAPLRGFRAAK